ncbi:MAG: response regulator [Bacteroidales bacterium]|nr:response regulator [Bacteroidales bacterium]
MTSYILIVDDEPNLSETLKDILMEEGYHCLIAPNGTTAIELVKKHDVRVILLDVCLPDIDGVEVFRQLLEIKPGLRIIFMSAYTVEDLKYRALDQGAIAFFEKPIDIPLVLQIVRESYNTAILFIGGDDPFYEDLMENLKKNNIHAVLVHSSHDAIELVRQIRFDIVFVDLTLPHMNGIDVYLAIKKITPTTVAIMIAGQEEEFIRIAQEAVNRNAYTYLKKPLDIKQTIRLIEQALCRFTSKDFRKWKP